VDQNELKSAVTVHNLATTLKAVVIEANVVIVTNVVIVVLQTIEVAEIVMNDLIAVIVVVELKIVIVQVVVIVTNAEIVEIEANAVHAILLMATNLVTQVDLKINVAMLVVPILEEVVPVDLAVDAAEAADHVVDAAAVAVVEDAVLTVQK
jgi:hypothetical protein